MVSLFAFILALAGVADSLSLRMSQSTKGTLVVFGGTGMTGREVVYQGLSQGCRVITLARTPSKMLYPDRVKGGAAGTPLQDPNLIVFQGDVTNAADVEKCFAAADDVIGCVVALGGKTKDVGPTMLTDGTRNIIESLKKKGQGKRIAVVTSIGAGDSEKQAPMMFKALMYTVMKSIFTDKNNQEKLFTQGGPGESLDYTIVRPGGLGVGEPTGIINVIDGEAGSIQRADVAQFCLGAVFDQNFAYLKKTPCISSSLGTSWKKQPEIAGFDKVKTAD